MGEVRMQDCELEEGEIQVHEEEERKIEEERKRREMRQKRKKRCRCERSDEGSRAKRREAEKEREGRTRNENGITEEKIERRDRGRKERRADGKSRSEHSRDTITNETLRDSNLSAQVRRKLCSSGGSMELGKLCLLLEVSREQMERIVKNEQGQSLMLKEENGKRVAVSRSSVRVCTQRLSECAGDCKNLHLCRYHVFGTCNRDPCAFSHNIHNDRNLEVLKIYELEELSIDELRQLVLQNDPSFLPEVCQHYNRGNGLYGSCSFKNECQKLHVCHYFLEGQCKYANACKRSHSLSNPQTQRQLEKWGISEDLVPQLPNIYRNASALRDTRAPLPKPKASSPGKKVDLLLASVKERSPGLSEEICVYYLNNICTHGDKCTRIHYHMPYKWQIQLSADWENMENMEDTEHAYCNVNRYRASEIHKCSFNFDTMTFKSYKIRRLSTPSSVCKSPELILTTEWRWYWYWEDKYEGRWNEYGKEKKTRGIPGICSADLEKAYLSDKEGTVCYKAGDEKYEIRLKDMVQTKLSTGTTRRICRRPRFVSAGEVKCRKLRRSSQDENTTRVPKHWDTTKLLKVTFKLVSLDETSDEYSRVKSLFHSSLRTVSILQIQRIQNLSLWKIYQRRKQQMEKQTEGREVKERQLFYASDDSLVATICQKNFDCSVCGIHGSRHETGSCFATNAYYSHINSPRNFIRTHVMFVARVLVGDFTEWNPSQQKYTSKEPFSRTYDSFGDSLSNPSIFTLFDNHQIYPEYVIRFL